MTDHGNPHGHGEGGGLPPPFDTTRNVYSVEVEYVVTAKLYVLAHHAEEALRLAEAKDLDDMIGFDDCQLWVDFDDRLALDDVTPRLTGNVNTTSHYDPKDHPDWNPEPKL